jgi:hypothetical protein
MTIANIYRNKSQQLNQLLSGNAIASADLGVELFKLIRTGWGPDKNSIFRPFNLRPAWNYCLSLDDNNKNNTLIEFSGKIISLLDTKNIDDFLLYFHDNITLPTQEKIRDQFAPVNGFYAATFFLMLKYPDEYFVNLRNPKNQISLHPLVLTNIVDRNIVDNIPDNTGNYLQNYTELCKQIKKRLNFIDFIDFINSLEMQYTTNNAGRNRQDVGSKNIILYGPPGTGKTYNTINESLKIIDSSFNDDRETLKNRFDQLLNTQILFVTFHQSYSYEDFVEGIRAETKDGQISYTVKDGVFKSICKAAKRKPNENYVLIIDEINRGNISKIFGELITLIEESKRADCDESLTVSLPYSGDLFSVPDNLYIIGTMNTADRSLALMDTALRRRFDFIEMMPKPELLNNVKIEGIDIGEMLETMNQRIEILYDREHTLGHAFFMPLIDEPTIENLAAIFKNKIIPLLQEYFFEDWEKIRMVFKDYDEQKTFEFIVKEGIPYNLFPNFVTDNRNSNLNSKIYKLNLSALYKPEAYIGIYQ